MNNTTNDMIMLTLEKIKKYFSPNIYNRGFKYYKEGRVLFAEEDQLEINGEVEGSGDEPYEVSVEFSKNGRILNTSCTCPYGMGCKHAAALLIHFYYNLQDELDGPVQDYENDAQEKSEDAVPPLIQPVRRLSEKTYALKESTLTSSFQTLLFKWETSEQAKQSDVKQYGPVFYLNHDNFNKWYVYPGLRAYSKKGKLLRIQKYNSEKNRDACEQLAEPIYEELVNFPETERARLENRILEFIDLKIPLHYWDIPGNEEPVRVCPIEKIEFGFKISMLDLRGNKFRFNYECNIKTVDGSYPLATQGNANLLIRGGLLCVLYPRKNALYYLCTDKKKTDFFKEFIKEIPSLNYSDIRKLAQYIKAQGMDSVFSVSFNRNAVKTINGIKPVPVLHCKNYNDYYSHNDSKTQCVLYFRYREREMLPELGAEYLIGEEQTTDNAIILYKRDMNFESSVIQFLYKKIKKILVNKDQWYFIHDENKFLTLPFIEFLDRYGKDLIENGFEICMDGERVQKSGGRIRIEVESGIDWFDLQVDFEDETGEIKPVEIDLYQLLQGRIKSNGKILYINNENLEKIKQLLQNGMGHDGKLRVPKLDFLLIDELYDAFLEKENPAVQRARFLAKKLTDFSHIEALEPPKSLQAELRTYQRAGLNWLYFLYKYELNGCLADDMGLGKTVQTIALLCKLIEEKQINAILIVAPVTTLANWEHEINRFAPSLKVVRHLGSNRIKDEAKIKENEIVLSSYHTLRNDIEYFKEFEFDYLILDEAHAIKNHTTKIYKSVRMINSKHRLALSGTPVENNELELWSLMNFLNPGLLKTSSDFKTRYIKASGPFTNEEEARMELRKKIYPFVLRRKKQEVVKELPEKQIITYHCEMEKDQREFYETTLKFYRQQMENALDEVGVEKSRMKLFEGLLRLRQSAIFPGLLDKKYNAISSCKFEAAREMLDDLVREGHKILFFSQFVGTLKIMEDFLKKQKYTYCYLDGSTKNRDEQITRFQQDDNVKVFLLSLKAGGVGINLYKANYVILFDPWWNPAVEAQAIDRSHRIGQTQKVTVYKMITVNSIEEKILLLQEKKKKLFEDLIAEDASFFKSLSREEILTLFS